MHGPAPHTDAGHSSTKGSGDAEVLAVNLAHYVHPADTTYIKYLATRDTFIR